MTDEAPTPGGEPAPLGEAPAPQPAAPARPAGDQELVTCVLGDVEFGLDINAVQEIVRIPRITPVPKAPPYVEGVANLRGNVLPIINSRARFGLPEATDPENSRVVVVELNGSPTGLIVDAVREVMRVGAGVIEDAPGVVQSIDGRYLRGVVKLDGGKRLVLLLDHDAVMDKEAFGGAAADHARSAGSGPSRRAEEQAGEDGSEQLVTFRLADEEYGIPIVDVQEIIRVPSISAIPNAPAGVIGIASLRNRILPVMDLRTRFGFRSRQAETDALLAAVAGTERRHAELAGRLREAAFGRAGFDRAALNAYREFERWQEGAAVGDKLARSLLAPVVGAQREAAEAGRRLAAMLGAGHAGVAAEFEAAAGPAHARLASAFEKLAAGLTRRDDERCLVVNLGGASVALRVDAVNQVLQAAKNTVEPTPRIVAGDGGGRDQIRGIAKLDGGKRLIMLLDVEKLVSRNDLRSIAGASGRPGGAGGPAGAGEEDERQLVSFKVGTEEFAVDIMQVQEIIRLGKVTKVPHVPDYVEGVVNLRGSVLPVIDLRKRVHLGAGDYNDSTRVVVVDLKGAKTGIIVDAVSEVMRVRTRSIEPAPAIVRSRYGDHFVEGVGKLNNGERMFLLLRADELLDSPNAG